MKQQAVVIGVLAVGLIYRPLDRALIPSIINWPVMTDITSSCAVEVTTCWSGPPAHRQNSRFRVNSASSQAGSYSPAGRAWPKPAARQGTHSYIVHCTLCDFHIDTPVRTQPQTELFSLSSIQLLLFLAGQVRPRYFLRVLAGVEHFLPLLLAVMFHHFGFHLLALRR